MRPDWVSTRGEVDATEEAPTARQCRLGAELRKMREHAGLTPTEAAALLGTDRTTISNTESGRFE